MVLNGNVCLCTEHILKFIVSVHFKRINLIIEMQFEYRKIQESICFMSELPFNFLNAGYFFIVVS